jgi:hypothetical protein
MCRYSEGLINERFDKFWPAAANAVGAVQVECSRQELESVPGFNP